jgi:hypothetical protein
VKSLFVLTLLTCLAGSALPQQQSHEPSNEVIKFRGAYLGQPLSDYVDCSSGKPKPLEKGYRTHGDLCGGKKAYLFHTKSHGFWDPQTEGEFFIFENRSVTKITIEVPNNDWEKVRFDLSQKLGQPTSEAPQEYQNGFGAHWEFNQGFWRKGNVIAYAGMQVSTLGHCGGFAAALASSSQPCSEAIRIVITTPERAGTPDSKANSLD